uniref:RNase H type-1 domain-containing protein n=1 Tax=Chenopodium quinoa TaxID=63459 RepID=A0A803MAS0_CHEQI
MDRPSSSSAPVTRVWGPPQKGFFKLNTIGSWIGLDNAGGGGVIRCDNGLWQEGFAINLNAMSGDGAELLAIRAGLLTAWTREIKHLELETDADALRKILRK